MSIYLSKVAGHWEWYVRDGNTHLAGGCCKTKRDAGNDAEKWCEQKRGGKKIGSIVLFDGENIAMIEGIDQHENAVLRRIVNGVKLQFRHSRTLESLKLCAS